MDNDIEKNRIVKRNMLLEQIAQCSDQIKIIDSKLIDLSAEKHQWDGNDPDKEVN